VEQGLQRLLQRAGGKFRTRGKASPKEPLWVRVGSTAVAAATHRYRPSTRATRAATASTTVLTTSSSSMLCEWGLEPSSRRAGRGANSRSTLTLATITLHCHRLSRFFSLLL
jgi:hypothetical protein